MYLRSLQKASEGHGMSTRSLGDLFERVKWGFPKIRGTLFWGSRKSGNEYFGGSIGVPVFWETTKCIGEQTK